MVVVEGATPLRLRRSNAKRNVFVRLRETPYFEIRYDILGVFCSEYVKWIYHKGYCIAFGIVCSKSGLLYANKFLIGCPL